MLGVDLTDIRRFKEYSETLLIKFLHPIEIEQFKKVSITKRADFLATRWAIKEAIFKADNQYYSFNQINITKDEVGRYVFKDFEISTSNEGIYIIAVVFKR
ncbi:ACP synthase [Metamycoplasma hominis]|uniref:4'-phosphopantetheinyl transferase superfamily protein n=1 Tax=Metamycoplasma hominis TaxID=2098 RepID=UPI0003709EC9|nr:4'-phosphopantetheinyl transferase superfamily protein [Metamycoplasma hominis]AIU33790.1 holo-ACP synthase [Metamycoplasma hominis ATCC 27545]OKL24049.1 ACP synthase [Metamycoplasma hominis]QKX40316.1 4'-phosphopantetheinyl transferase superfamily protein [Metamycoplasma hominis]QKX40890.1 4'-phosphopantetheinyl transferase superfamily protein [Metamycoplasma hominis]RAW47640.1 ACP synthase [Metamycoplasma hominis]